jgi:hypothetical protein
MVTYDWSRSLARLRARQPLPEPAAPRARAALAANTLLSVCLGGVVPLVLKRFRTDPALVSGPLLTTVTDMCGFLLVLKLAEYVLVWGVLPERRCCLGQLAPGRVRGGSAECPRGSSGSTGGAPGRVAGFSHGLPVLVDELPDFLMSCGGGPEGKRLVGASGSPDHRPARHGTRPFSTSRVRTRLTTARRRAR